MLSESPLHCILKSETYIGHIHLLNKPQCLIKALHFFLLLFFLFFDQLKSNSELSSHLLKGSSASVLRGVPLLFTKL